MKHTPIFAGIAFALTGCLSPTSSNDLAAAFAESGGTTFSASSPVITRDSGSGNANEEAAQDYSVTFSEATDGTLVATTVLFGETVSFTEADLDTSGKVLTKTLADGVTDVTLTSYNGTWADIQAGNAPYKYAVAFEAAESHTTFDFHNSFSATQGLQTAAADMPMSGTADFNGDFDGAYYIKSNYNVKAAVEGDVLISANFGATTPTIDGSLSNLTVNGNAEPDVFLIDSANIASDGTYASTITLDGASCAPDCPTVTSSDVSGAFYGPSAEETGGKITLQGVSSNAANNNPYIIEGAFVAAQ